MKQNFFMMKGLYAIQTSLMGILFVFTICLEAQNPAGVSGATLWLKADAGISNTNNDDPIDTWVDQTMGNANSASQSGTTRPKLKNNTFNLLNFNPCVSFDGADDFMTIANPSDFPSGNEGHHIFAVVRPLAASNASQAKQYVFGQSDNDPTNDDKRYDFSASPTMTRVWAKNARISSDLTNGMPEYLTDISTSGGASAYINTATLCVNGAPVPSKIIGDNRTNPLDIHNANVYIGQSGEVGNFYTGHLMEIITYNQALTGNNRLKVQSYLAYKYGITLQSAIVTSITQSPTQQRAHDVFTSTPTSVAYLSSDATIKMWDNTIAAPGFENNVCGIGMDMSSGLQQNIATSANSDAVVVIANGDVDNFTEANTANTRHVFTQNLHFQSISNDGLGTGAWNSDTTITPNGFRILDRQWQVQEHGSTSIGAVTLAFNVENLNFNIENVLLGSSYYLLIDTNNDGDYITETPIELTQNGAIWYTETPIDLTHLSRFSLATQASTLSLKNNPTFAFSVFPNPAKNTINIVLDEAIEDVTASVFDSTGRRITRFNLNDSNKMDISNYTSGLYFLQLKSGSKTSVTRFIKQ